MKKVILKIYAKQRNDRGEEDVMELVTEGKFYHKDGATYLVYEESELSGMEGCVTTLIIENKRVRLKRYGAASHELQFEEGKKFTGIYETPMGCVDMEILTEQVENTIAEEAAEGLICIEYEISLRGLMEARNKLRIEITEKEE